MRKLISLLVLAVIIPICVYSQINEGQISISPVIANEDLPEEAIQNLSNKLMRTITSNGYGSIVDAERFVLVASIDVINNDIVPSTPPRISKKIDITLIVGDIIENKSFGSCHLISSGIGTNDNKAFIAAFSNINPSNKDIKNMFEESMMEISNYYSNSTLFLTTARSYFKIGEYDKAIAYLMTIPPINQITYNLCQEEICSIYRNKIDEEGLVLYRKALNIWNSTRNLEGAKQVASIVDEVNPYSSAMNSIDSLWNDISIKLQADELAEIEAQKRAHEERMKEAEITAEVTKTFLSAAKAVGMAFGIFQPRIVVNRIVRGWF